MLGLELIVAGMLHFSPERTIKPIPVVAKIECRVKTPPRINVLPSKSRVRYDFTKSKADLNKVDVDTVSPYGPHHKTSVSGLMSGSIQVKHQVSFMYESYQQLDQGCIYLRSVEVKVHVDPTVYVASDYAKGTCMHNDILKHERKHVREDQLIVNKYSNSIGRALANVVDSRGAAFGPYRIDDMPQVQKNIQDSITEIVKNFNDQMNVERQRRQQAIDNLGEYESIGRQCKGSSTNKRR